MSKTPHLTDLFKTGQSLTITIPNVEDIDNPTQIEIWMRKPSAQQYDEALNKARGKQGRRRQLYRDPESDEFVSLNEQVLPMSKDELVEQLMTFEQADLQSQAYNEALYGDNNEEEPRWGKEGRDYLDVLAGLRQRFEEIEEYNSKLTEEDKETMSLKPEEDEEIQRLNKYVDQFGELRDELLEKLKAKKEAEYQRKATDELRKVLMKKMIDLETNLIHYQEFKTMMVFFAARNPDDHHKHYFKNPDQIWDLPDYVRIQLFNAYDDLEAGATALKNLPSPQTS